MSVVHVFEDWAPQKDFIIVTNKNYIYQGGVVVLFDEKRTKNRDLRRGGRSF